MVTIDEMAKEIYIQMIIKDDINVFNPGAPLLAAKRAESAYALAEIFLEVSGRMQRAEPGTPRTV